MADSGNRRSSARRQPNRLQKRAPASLQICPAAEWKTAIPLLSPLVQSPNSDDSTVDVGSCPNANSVGASEKPVVVMKKWQHPAAPFGYEPPQSIPFFNIGVSNRL